MDKRFSDNSLDRNSNGNFGLVVMAKGGVLLIVVSYVGLGNPLS